MKKNVLTTGLVCAVFVLGAGLLGTAKSAKDVAFTKLWTHGHTDTGQVSEIPAYDAQTNTIWVAGVVGVDVLNAATGDLVEHISVTTHGAVNSVAIFNGLAALAVEAKSFNATTCPLCDRRNPGKVLFYDTRTRELADGISEVPVGALPDMLTFTHDGSKLLVANEGTPNRVADVSYALPSTSNPPPPSDPPGTVTIIDVAARTVLATAGLAGVGQFGDSIRQPATTGMDFEPEYIAVTKDGTKAYVTLQEGNAIGELDLTINAFTRIIGLGAKDFNATGNAIDPSDTDAKIDFINVNVKGLYMPDGVDTYSWKGRTFMVLANEGDFREDGADQGARGAFGAVAPLNRLRMLSTNSSTGNLVTAGGRSFSIRDGDGEIVYDSGNLLETEAKARSIYDDARSDDKGVEPEGVTLLEAKGRVFAFVGLERTTKSAVAIFDVTSPYDVRFLDMIVTAGDLAPEGLAVYKNRGDYYLVISNETPTAGLPSNTTLYRIDIEKGDKNQDEE